MANSLLRQVELRLLRCTFPLLPSRQPPSPSVHPLIDRTLSLIEQGEYAEGLSCSAATWPPLGSLAATWQFEDSTECAERFYSELEQIGKSNGGDGESEIGLNCAVLLCVGVASLLAFTQQNVTGPIRKFSPFPVPIGGLSANENSSTGQKWDAWASSQLSSVGSHIHGKFSLLQYIIFAKTMFTIIKDLHTKPENYCQSVNWWMCRLILIQQRILDELSSSLFNELELYKKDLQGQFGNLEQVSSYWSGLLLEGEGSNILSMACLEGAILEYKYGRVDSAREYLNCAKEECKLDLSLTGILGFRTIHQVDAKAQLVLVANAQENTILKDNKNGSNSIPHKEDEECEILRAPRLVDNGNESNCNSNGNNTDFKCADVVLTGVQLAVVMGECMQLRRTSRDDELSGWEKAPYIEFIDSQQQSYYAIKSLCDLLRVRWESTRGRTKQRALLMMENLAELIDRAIPVASERIQLTFGVYMPTIPALKKEYSELLVSCGLVGEALKILEDLELWDNLIDCYRLLGKKAAAVDLIKERLTDRPNDPRLWCSLGDVTTTDSYYEKALEVSNNKSARAMRSLARSAYNRDDFKTAKTLWESALDLNSLYPDGWFSLGAASWKDGDLDKAVDAFTRAVQIDPDNGEAWNNIGCLHMKRNKSEAAFIAFNQAIKYKRNSWEVWENFSKVAFDTGHLQQALEAVKMVLGFSSNKRLDTLLLDRVMTKLEEKSPIPALSAFNDAQETKLETESKSEMELECTIKDQREFEFLLDMLGNILQQVVKNNPNEEIWGFYARWHKIKGNLAICSESLLKQIRSLQGTELWHDEKKFKKFANASLKLCRVYMEISSSTGSRKELFSAQMHLRSSLKQAVNFSEMEEFKSLNDCLDEIKKRIDASST